MFYEVRGISSRGKEADRVCVFVQQLATTVIRFLERPDVSRVEVTTTDEKTFMKYQKERRRMDGRARV